MFIHRIPPEQSLEEGLNAAFAAFDEADADHCAIVFPEDTRPAREMVGLIVDLLLARRNITELCLVHPFALMGFLVSSIGMRCPHTRVLYQPFCIRENV